jgi:GDP-D-mannose dehydratase
MPQITSGSLMQQQHYGPESYMYAQSKDEVETKVPEAVKKLEIKEEKESKEDAKKKSDKKSDEKKVKSDDTQKPPAKINLQLEEQEGQ